MASLPVIAVFLTLTAMQANADPPPGRGWNGGGGGGGGRSGGGSGRMDRRYDGGRRHHWGGMDWDTTKTCSDELAKGKGGCDSFRKCCENICEPNGQGYQADCVLENEGARVRCRCFGGGSGGGSNGDSGRSWGGGTGSWHGRGRHSSEQAPDNTNDDFPRYHQWRPPRTWGPVPQTEVATNAPIRPAGGNKGCGVPTVQPTARIVGGTEAKPHSWPWQISLQLRGRHLCGGSLISPTHILTAAHCFGLSSRASSYQVMVGMHDRSTGDGTTVGVSKIYVHPNYDEDANSNDAAIAVLAQPVSFSDKVTPICLPQQDVAGSTSCEATGWGSTEGTGNNRYLLQVRVPIIDRSTCNDRSHYAGRIDNTMICAGATGKDSCQGDSGGPLVCQRSDGVWELQGITSWGSDCAENNKPGVYTRVMSVKDWVTKIMTT